MISLDDMSALGRLDKSDMLGLIDAFPRHCREGWNLGLEWAGCAGLKAPGSIVVAGMGGSAIAGDLVLGLVSRALKIPMVVVRDYELPGWVGPGTAVVCCSYSGETEETLAAFRRARESGAYLLTISSGGTLSREAEASGASNLPVPGGMQPRAALGYPLFGLIALIETLGAAGTMAQDVRKTFEALEEARLLWGEGVPEDRNEAKSLARALAGALPVVYAPEGPLGAVGFRWRTQLNENSKLIAYNCVFPELDHNEIVGWARPFNVERPVAVFLRDRNEPERMRYRIEITRDLVADAGVAVKEAWADGDPLACMACLTYLGDYASVYAAFLRGYDPTPVDVIGRLKEKLSER